MTFEKDVKRIRTLPKKPSDEELLKLYGLYKQAVYGENTTSKPYFYDLKGIKKWEHWNENKGLNKVTSMCLYSKFVDELFDKYV